MRRLAKQFVVGLMIFFAAFAVAAAEDVSAVRGVVRDGVTGRVLARVRVVVQDSQGTRYEMMTDRQGRFGAIGLASGYVYVTVDKAGYDPDTGACRLRSGDSARFDFAMRMGPLGVDREAQACTIDPYTSDKYVIQ